MPLLQWCFESPGFRMADRVRARQGFELFFVVVTAARAVTEILQFVYQGLPMPADLRRNVFRFKRFLAIKFTTR
jgi:hypothetical protein